MAIRLFSTAASTAAVAAVVATLATTLATTGSAIAEDDVAPDPQVYDTGRLGIGGAVGHEWQVDERDGDQLSVLGQFRITHRLSVELEYGRTEYDDSNAVDKRMGAGLSLQVGKLAFLSPFVVAATGTYGDQERDPYIEAGGGVKFPISRNMVLMLDVRSGHRWGDDQETLVPLAVAGDGVVEPKGSHDGELDYSRWRLVGMVFF